MMRFAITTLPADKESIHSQRPKGFQNCSMLATMTNVRVLNFKLDVANVDR